MTIGLDEFHNPGKLGFGQLLVQPFRSEPDRYPINRRGRKDDTWSVFVRFRPPARPTLVDG